MAEDNQLSRECPHAIEELNVEHARLTNRLRDQLWRYYPQMLELGDLDEEWMLDLSEDSSGRRGC